MVTISGVTLGTSAAGTVQLIRNDCVYEGRWTLLEEWALDEFQQAVELMGLLLLADHGRNDFPAGAREVAWATAHPEGRRGHFESVAGLWPGRPHRGPLAPIAPIADIVEAAYGDPTNWLQLLSVPQASPWHRIFLMLFCTGSYGWTKHYFSYGDFKGLVASRVLRGLNTFFRGALVRSDAYGATPVMQLTAGKLVTAIARDLAFAVPASHARFLEDIKRWGAYMTDKTAKSTVEANVHFR